MTQADQQKLFEALRTPLIHPDKQIQDQFDAITMLDVYNAQPVVEELKALLRLKLADDDAYLIDGPWLRKRIADLERTLATGGTKG